jgi:hypothetical protein
MVDQSDAVITARAFVMECREHGLFFEHVYLFGSFASNTFHEGSDIDLLLISDQFSENVFENLNLYSKINIRYPIIETHPYPTHYFEKGDDFLLHIMKNCIELF